MLRYSWHTSDSARPHELDFSMMARSNFKAATATWLCSFTDSKKVMHLLTGCEEFSPITRPLSSSSIAMVTAAENK